MVKKDTAENEVAKKATAKAKATTKAKAVKDLTLAALVAENKKLDATREFEIMAGDTKYKLRHDVFFRPTKMDNLLQDIISFYEQTDDAGEQLLEIATPFMALMVIKHFTSLDVPDDFDEALYLLNVLTDLGALDTIVNALPEDQVQRVNEMLETTLSIFAKNIEEQAEAISRLVEEDQLDRKSVV